MYKNNSIIILRMRKCIIVVDKMQTYIVAAVVLPLFISYYFTQSHYRNLTEGNKITQLMTLPGNPELKILPLHTQTPLARILPTWPIKASSALFYLLQSAWICCWSSQRTKIHKHRKCRCWFTVAYVTSLETWMEVATYTEIGYILFVIHCGLLRSGLYNIPPSHLRCDCTGWYRQKSTAKQVIALRSVNSDLSIDKVPPEITGPRYGPLKRIY
jgi:hypothetical protein